MNIPFLAVFIQGLLSFFSPCVLPLLPVYMGYLSGGTLKNSGDGKLHYDRKKVMINTFFFVIGVSFAFFLLGMGISALGRFFSGNQFLFARIGGIIVVLFGFYQLGFLGDSRLLNRELKLPVNFSKMTMSPVTALVMGFVISFAWSPCIGPILSSVLIMAASSKSATVGFVLIGVYTLGYIIPFLLVGLFTTTLLEFFGKHRSIMTYAVKIGGAIMIIMGFLMFTGKMNSISGYLSQFTGADISATINDAGQVADGSKQEDDADQLADASRQAADDADQLADASDRSGNKENDDRNAAKSDATDSNDAENKAADTSENSADSDKGAEGNDDSDYVMAPDFTLTDQYGVTHSLSDYRGKTVFLNFWATWCPPCRAEMPDIQELYEEYSKQEDPDVVILAVAFPNYGDETDAEGVAAFLEQNGYTYPVLMDEGASLALPYYITAYPTTFMIGPDGKVLGYIPGGMTKDIMKNVISQAKEYADSLNSK